MEEAATDNRHLAPPNCSVLAGSKMHADTGSNSPQLLFVVVCTVRVVDVAFDSASYSAKSTHDLFHVVPEVGRLGIADVGLPERCFKRWFVVPLN